MKRVECTELERLGLEAAVQARVMARGMLEAAKAQAGIDRLEEQLHLATGRYSSLARAVLEAHGESPNGDSRVSPLDTRQRAHAY